MCFNNTFYQYIFEHLLVVVIDLVLGTDKLPQSHHLKDRYCLEIINKQLYYMHTLKKINHQGEVNPCWDPAVVQFLPDRYRPQTYLIILIFYPKYYKIRKVFIKGTIFLLLHILLKCCANSNKVS